jgi:type IV secretory pathway VirB9-like protein
MKTSLMWGARGLWLIWAVVMALMIGTIQVMGLQVLMGDVFASMWGLIIGIIWMAGDRWLSTHVRPRPVIYGLMILVGIVGLMGCSTTRPPMLPPISETPAPMPDVAVSVTEPVMPPAEDTTASLLAQYPQAIVRPQAHDFRGVVAHLPDYPQALFALTLRYRQPLTILLPLGEVAEPLITDDWWQVINTVSGEGANRRGVIVIQALNDQPQTSYTSIITNKAVRFLELTSSLKGRRVQAVTWVSPEPPKPKLATAWPAGLYHTDYQIEPKDGGPAWKPLQVWTIPDRQKTVILWPAAKFQRKAPVIYVLGPDGKERQIVNRRTKGHYTEIDELFDAAELRVGHDPKNAEVAYIRAPATKTIWCPGPECPAPIVQGVR